MVLGAVLSLMAEKSAPVFVVATANDVNQLPPEMLRKGGWYELLFVDVPNQAEREAIWNIQIARHGRKAKDFDIRQLAKATDGLTGSEIEAAFVDALYHAFEDGKGTQRFGHLRGADGVRAVVQDHGGTNIRVKELGQRKSKGGYVPDRGTQVEEVGGVQSRQGACQVACSFSLPVKRRAYSRGSVARRSLMA